IRSVNVARIRDARSFPTRRSSDLLALSSTRVAAFAVASPIYARILPGFGRIALVLVLGLFLSHPVIVSDSYSLIAAGLINAVIGAALGLLTGVLFYIFQVAGGVLDFTSGLSVSGVLDPMTGQRDGVFARIVGLAAGARFVAVGADHLQIGGLGRSVEAIPLVRVPSHHSGPADLAVSLHGRLRLAAVELAFPAVAALFL